ncbi:MAG: AbrB/MazE/SpoVT family DNA-binding domain-containing protein [Promethearchaeota archaeon]
MLFINKLISTISDKGLTTIPKEIRKKLKIKKGDKIYWVVSDKFSSDLIIITDPLKYLTGRYSNEELTYENLEEKADDIILDLVKKNSSN